MGQPQNVVTALPTLIRLARKAKQIRSYLGCTGAFLHQVPEDAREIDELNWSVCPLCLLASPFCQAILELDRLARIAPLAGWPDRYAYWAVRGLTILRDAQPVAPGSPK